MAAADLTYADLRKSIKARSFSPVYLFHGAEDFLVDEAVRLIIDAALSSGEQEFNLDVMKGGETDARTIVSHASSFPMMAERRVVVVRDFDKAGDLPLLADYVERPLASTVLVLTCEKPDFRKRPYTALRKHASVLEFKPLWDNQIPEWISRRVAGLGKVIDAEAARLLAACVGSSLREIANEIDKLFAYVGEKKTITADDVNPVVGFSKEFNIFELQRYLGVKDMRRSCEVLEHMIEGGEAPILIVIMLTRYFVVLYKLCDLQGSKLSSQEIARTAGVSPYYIKEYQNALNFYTVEEIEHAFELLTRADESLKSSGDPRQVLQLLLVDLISHGELVAYDGETSWNNPPKA
jgi:DNA polymerase-3 subunit delta